MSNKIQPQGEGWFQPKGESRYSYRWRSPDEVEFINHETGRSGSFAAAELARTDSGRTWLAQKEVVSNKVPFSPETARTPMLMEPGGAAYDERLQQYPMRKLPGVAPVAPVAPVAVAGPVPMPGPAASPALAGSVPMPGPVASPALAGSVPMPGPVVSHALAGSVPMPGPVASHALDPAFAGNLEEGDELLGVPENGESLSNRVARIRAALKADGIATDVAPKAPGFLFKRFWDAAKFIPGTIGDTMRAASMVPRPPESPVEAMQDRVASVRTRPLPGLGGGDQLPIR